AVHVRRRVAHAAVEHVVDQVLAAVHAAQRGGPRIAVVLPVGAEAVATYRHAVRIEAAGAGDRMRARGTAGRRAAAAAHRAAAAAHRATAAAHRAAATAAAAVAAVA